MGNSGRKLPLDYLQVDAGCGSSRASSRVPGCIRAVVDQEHDAQGSAIQTPLPIKRFDECRQAARLVPGRHAYHTIGEPVSRFKERPDREQPGLKLARPQDVFHGLLAFEDWGCVTSANGRAEVAFHGRSACDTNVGRPMAPAQIRTPTRTDACAACECLTRLLARTARPSLSRAFPSSRAPADRRDRTSFRARSTPTLCTSRTAERAPWNVKS